MNDKEKLDKIKKGAIVSGHIPFTSKEEFIAKALENSNISQDVEPIRKEERIKDSLKTIITILQDPKETYQLKKVTKK